MSQSVAGGAFLGALNPDSTLMMTKGHGTGNDFMLACDPADSWSVSESMVKALCNRRTGLGGDGFIRAVRVADIDEDIPAAGDAVWFMDYRNHDGSLSQMCGNGVRVFASYLEALGHLDSSDPSVRRNGVTIATRSGPKVVFPAQPDDDGVAQWRVDMGSYLVAPAEGAGPERVQVTVPGLAEPKIGLGVSTGNPHVVVLLDSEAELDALDLTAPPVLDPVPPEGANVEFVVLGEASDELGVARMRVHERGSGETFSCGTGACAVGITLRRHVAADRGPDRVVPDRWVVQLPGGRLVIDCEPDRVWMTGPAVLVADVGVDIASL